MTSFWINIRFILILCVLGIAFFTFKKIKISFHCTARTEFAKIEYKGERGIKWRLVNVDIKSKGFNEDNFTGYLEFHEKKHIDKKNTIEICPVRYSNGDFIVNINSINHNQVGTIRRKNGAKIEIKDKIRIRWIKSEISRLKRNNIIIPVVGNIILGDIPTMAGEAGSHILYYGEVTLRGHSYFSTRLFEIDKHKLEKGEKFEITKYSKLKNQRLNKEKADNEFKMASYGHGYRQSKRESFGRGYLLLDKDKGFYIVVDAIAYEGKVIRYGSKGYTIAATLFSRIRNDTIIQAFWLSILILFSIMELRDKIFSLKRKERK